MLVKDLMMRNVVTVQPEDFILKAARLLLEKGYNGLPVVNEKGLLVGILTEYDLVAKESEIHLPTFIKLLKEFEIYKKDRSSIQGELERIVSLRVKDVMNPLPLSVYDDDTIEHVANAFALHHRVNPISVIDHYNMLVGVMSRHDLITFYAGTREPLRVREGQDDLDKEVDHFLKDFERRFIAIKKSRMHNWFSVFLIIVLVGIIMALMVYHFVA